MSYQTRAYDDEHGQPVAVLVVDGTHDVSRLVNLFAGGVVEQLQAGQKLLKQIKRHNGGRHALELLAAHGGPDFTDPADPAIGCPPTAPAGPADFFQAGRTYIQAKPFTPPEHLTVFHCTAVDTRPGSDGLGEPFAFGFATPAHPGDHWSVYLCRQEAWSDGWTEYDATEQGASRG